MASNTTPNFTKNGVVGSVLVTAANTSSQGGGTIATNIFLALTAGADGTFVEYVRWIATATTPTTTTATVGRVFASSVTSGATTSANTILIGEVPLPATAADNASTAVNSIDVPVNFRLPSGWTILVTNHAAPAANTNWRAIAIGGDY